MIPDSLKYMRKGERIWITRKWTLTVAGPSIFYEEENSTRNVTGRMQMCSALSSRTAGFRKDMDIREHLVGVAQGSLKTHSWWSVKSYLRPSAQGQTCTYPRLCQGTLLTRERVLLNDWHAAFGLGLPHPSLGEAGTTKQVYWRHHCPGERRFDHLYQPQRRFPGGSEVAGLKT